MYKQTKPSRPLPMAYGATQELQRKDYTRQLNEAVKGYDIEKEQFFAENITTLDFETFYKTANDRRKKAERLGDKATASGYARLAEIAKTWEPLGSLQSSN